MGLFQLYEKIITPTMKCRTNGIVCLCLSVCLSVCVCLCYRDKSKNNARIFTNLSTQVETSKISDSGENSRIQVKNSLGLLSNVAYVVLYKLSEYKKQNI